MRPLFFSSLEKIGWITGAAEYTEEAPFTDPRHARLVISARLGGLSSTLWVVDTGAPWCVISPYLAKTGGLVYEEVGRQKDPLIIRGEKYTGQLIRAPLCLTAHWGKPLVVEATLFLPDAEENEEEFWRLPNFLGWGGCLSRFRFSIDPTARLFGFGPCEEGGIWWLNEK